MAALSTCWKLALPGSPAGLPSKLNPNCCLSTDTGANMPVIEYASRTHRKKVIRLFAAIYPQWPEAECRRMAYDEKQPHHRLTLLAMHHETPVGQINLFSIDPDQRLGNIGYHVHPNWQRKGVGSLLLNKAGVMIDGHFQDGVVVQTTTDNVGSISLARKAGFAEAPDDLLARHSCWLKLLRLANGLCLHLPKEKHLRMATLEKRALHARRWLDGGLG
jgi:RimJ/RimL family protein N-acetyltransferase